MQSNKKHIKFRQFSSTQLVPSTPVNDHESFNAFAHMWHSARVIGADSRSHSVNAQRAQFRATNLRREVAFDMAFDWLMVDEREGIGRQPHPPLTSFSARANKVVRFADQVDTEEFDFVQTKQCELCSAHELCFKAFWSRIMSARSSSHALNASQALGRGFRQRTEVELQEEEDETTTLTVNMLIEDKEPWVVIDASADEDLEQSLSAGSTRDEVRPQRKQTKRCFWILDAGRTPQEQQRSCEGKRWQDHVRHCTTIV
eukprot:TRINITY_DN34015_c0_g1_i1.p1 TRINITY_DN34015_c0_g1~~TRINITY_DN34015_c0_g1_i1.p1  ORF type:complete len:258 (-),score=30.71 TRINITY_DN34015_c0_g1_i1:148-921(-)